MSEPSAKDKKESASSGKTGMIDKPTVTVVQPKGLVPDKEQLPEDQIAKISVTEVKATKRDIKEHSNATSEQPAHYISSKWRDQLDQQIEILYTRVSNELNDNPKDVVFALEKLRYAHSITMVDDSQQYEEALQSVLVVKEMLLKKRHFRQWSYTWGVAVFLYALVWLIVCLAGFSLNFAETGGLNAGLWYSALAGGIGGVAAIFYSLYWQISIKQEFDRQYLMKYLVQPILGFFLGTVMYFILNTGFLAVNSNQEQGGGFISLALLLSFIAGFGQQPVYDLVDNFAHRLSSKADKDGPSDDSKQDDTDELQEYFAKSLKKRHQV